jgi:hypothetical protein
MFQTSEQLLEFVDNADGVLLDQIFEGAVADMCLYEDETIVQALDKYVEMLETDTVDEKFEEHLSVLMVPYFASTATFYEGVMVLEEGKIKMKTALAKSAIKKQMKRLGRHGDIRFKAKRAMSNAPARLKAKAGATKAQVKRGMAAAGQKLSNAKFDAQFKGRAFMKRMRHKIGPKALANRIKKGYASAVKWAKGTKLGQKVNKAYAAGMAKRSERLGRKSDKAAKAAEKAMA